MDISFFRYKAGVNTCLPVTSHGYPGPNHNRFFRYRGKKNIFVLQTSMLCVDFLKGGGYGTF